MILELFKSLAPSIYMAEASIGDVVIEGVMEGRQLMIRVLSSKLDALGRSFGQEAE